MTAISTCIACIVTPLISFIQEKLACEGPPCIDTHISYIYIYKPSLQHCFGTS